MIQNIYIDGTDVRAQYGVWIRQGGYNDLLTFPALREPVSNCWPEHDGIEVDLSHPVLEPLTATVAFVASGSAADVAGFVRLLAQPGYREVQLPTLGRTFRVRYSGGIELARYGSQVAAFELQFELDTPERVDPASWLAPGVPITRSVWSIDGTSLDAYGLFVQRGRDSLLLPPTVKQALTRRNATIDGQHYDAAAPVCLNSKEITIKCGLKAATPQRMWSCRDALFNRLIAPGEHRLRYRDAQLPVYYRNCTACRLLALRKGLAMYEFELNLTVIR